MMSMNTEEANQNAGVPLSGANYPASNTANAYVYAGSYPSNTMSTVSEVDETGRIMIQSRQLLMQGRTLKALCLCEMIFAIWMMFLGGGFLAFLVFIPADIIGVVASQRLHKNLLAGFACYKAAIFCLAIVFYAEIFTGVNFNALSVIWIILVAYQLLSMVTAVRLRQNIMLSERSPSSNLEMQAAAALQQNQPSPQQMHQIQMQQVMQQQMMAQQQQQQQQMMQQQGNFVPSHFMQPAYPPVPFMPQNSQQGFPVVMPYPIYPQSQVSPYPTYVLSEEEAQAQGQPQQTRNADQQPLIQ